MTEEQKIEALKRILQGANVAQVNLGDGYQTFNMGKDGKWQQEPTSNAEVVDAEVVVEQSMDNRQNDENDSIDMLIRFVFDDGEREKVVTGLQTCEDTRQVAAFARKLWIEEIIEYDVLRSAEFHRAIIPLLKFDISESALKQAIAKQVRE